MNEQTAEYQYLKTIYGQLADWLLEVLFDLLDKNKISLAEVENLLRSL